MPYEVAALIAMNSEVGTAEAQQGGELGASDSTVTLTAGSLAQLCMQ